MAGVYTDQRLNLSKLGKAFEESQGFKPDPGNLAVRDYRGASGNVSHGGTVNRLVIERAGAETPHLQRGAPDFYPVDLSSRQTQYVVKDLEMGNLSTPINVRSCRRRCTRKREVCPRAGCGKSACPVVCPVEGWHVQQEANLPGRSQSP